MVSDSLIKELRDQRNYIGQTPEKRSELEGAVKSRYQISDWDSGAGVGYDILDTQNDEHYFFSPNSRLTLETRYLEKDEKRNVTENALDLFARVAVNIAEADLKYDSGKDIAPIAEEFLENLVKQNFMPNTPTLCNAGRQLQQLSACFVLPIEDYMATDDIGEDPEKQGAGIYDTLRYMAMVHKSGGGTGFNFGKLRPKSDRISTTFGASSGPVSFIRVYDASTNAVNQGGFRRGANMGILPYTHPDIFEFVGEKANNGGLENFNLSVGVDDTFMESVKTDGYFRLVNPKNENKLPLEERLWKGKNLLKRGEEKFEELFEELGPSLVLSEEGNEVINVATEEVVGKVGDDDEILISSKALFDYIVDCSWREGCPGILNLGRLEENNKTPHVGKIDATNPCGEQPLLPYEACNLGGINLSNCITDGKFDYDILEKRIESAVHFLDNVIDMSKFPFKKVFGVVHGTRKIGMGLMGFAEALTSLGMKYGGEDSIEFARNLSKFMTETGMKYSEKLAEDRGTFPFFEGSVHERDGRRLRNATITTIAPNGTTGMIADANGGCEPYFKVAYTKTCMDGRVLEYWAPGLKEEITKLASGKELEKLLEEIKTSGSIQHIDEIPKSLKDRYLASHEVSPEDHIKIQAAFQTGKEGVGVHNAVSKTVNLPNTATREDIASALMLSYDLGAVGTTVFRDGSKDGVYGSLEQKLDGLEVTLVQNNVKVPQIMDVKPQALTYRVKRFENGDSLHMTIASELYIDDEAGKAYFLPDQIFQARTPLGHATSVSFAQSGIDRTEIFRGGNPDYTEIVGRLQSASSSEEEGLGPNKIKSIEHAVGMVLEHALLTNGVVEHDELTKKLSNVVRKENLRHVDSGSDEFDEIVSQVRVGQGRELVVSGNHGKLGRRFVCERCGCTEFMLEAGCNHPKCKNCGEIEGGGCD
jgi:ribonucleoside-diphosphate reductase alpha chain